MSHYGRFGQRLVRAWVADEEVGARPASLVVPCDCARCSRVDTPHPPTPAELADLFRPEEAV